MVSRCGSSVLSARVRSAGSWVKQARSRELVSSRKLGKASIRIVHIEELGQKGELETEGG